MSAFSPYLLQSLSEFQIQTNPKDTIGFIVVVVLTTALFIYMNVSKTIRNSKAFKGEGIEIPKWNRPRVDPRFYRTIKSSGLSKREVAKLEKILGYDGGYPEEVLYDSAKLDASFEHAYDHILREYSSEDARQALLELFSIRNAIEYFLTAGKSGNAEIIPHKFRRKQTDIKCVLHVVITKKVRVKFKMQKKLVLANIPMYSGTVLNVSQSGCAILTTQSIKAGSFLKIEFNINDTLVIALGSVRRLNMNGDNWVYHIKFLKLSRNSIIALNSFIFGYKKAENLRE
jgi:hypothetical protein